MNIEDILNLLNTYQKQTRETAIYPEIGKKFVYPVLGLVGEIGELLEKFENNQTYFAMSNSKNIDTTELEGEIGDVLWYIARTAEEFGFTMSDLIKDQDCFVKNIIDIRHSVSQMVIDAGLLSGKVKKIFRDKDGEVSDEVKELIRLYLWNIFNSLNGLCDKMHINVIDVSEKNIDKLFDRKKRGKIKGDGDNR